MAAAFGSSGRAAAAAFWAAASLVALIGQACVQRPQPVQSSAEICRMNFWPLKAPALTSAERKPAGAASRAAGSATLARMAACGQTAVQLRHWMQASGFHAGTEVAMLRFSHCVVETG